MENDYIFEVGNGTKFNESMSHRELPSSWISRPLRTKQKPPDTTRICPNGLCQVSFIHGSEQLGLRRETKDASGITFFLNCEEVLLNVQK